MIQAADLKRAGHQVEAKDMLDDFSLSLPQPVSFSHVPSNMELKPIRSQTRCSTS